MAHFRKTVRLCMRSGDGAAKSATGGGMLEKGPGEVFDFLPAAHEE